MRYAALLLMLFALFTVGCGKVEKEIETPGPAPPFNPKDAAMPANLTPDKPADLPLESAWNPAKDGKQKEPAESATDATDDAPSDPSAEESK